MKQLLDILYVANSDEIPHSRVKAYASLCELSNSSDIIFTFPAGFSYSIWYRLLNKIRLTPDPAGLNKRIVHKVAEMKPDIVFIVKGNCIKPSTLKKIKKTGCKIIFWSNDDMYGKHNRSLWLTKGFKLYDLVVTQKSYNCNTNELPSLGVRNILFQNKAYDPRVHHKVDCNSAIHKHEVVFVGAYEKERLDYLKFLAENNIDVHVYGWVKKMNKTHRNLHFHNHYLYGDDYAGVFCCSKISLNFLRRLNRDKQTSRSVEIPACGGFMLAERSDEHERLFKEDEEAVYFSSKTELLDKIKYYLSHEKERKRIAEAGYARCQKDDYSFDNRMKEIIAHLNSIS